MVEFGRTLQEEINIWKEKIEKSLLPPDPARIVKAALRVPATIEHVSPLPPLIERVHAEFTEKMIEKLPRLPLTGDFPIHEWEKWIKE